MATPQGSAVLAGEYLDQLTAAVNSIDSSAALQVLVDQAVGAISPVKASITAQLAQVSPWAALLDPPTSPDKAVTWITSFITSYLKPMAAPALVYPLQLAMLATKTAALVDAIERAKQRIPNCHVTVPVL